MNILTLGVTTTEKIPHVNGTAHPKLDKEEETETVRTVPLFESIGGLQNRFLKGLISEKILNENYRLVKDVNGLLLPKLNTVQMGIFDDFLESTLTVNISNEANEITCSFKIWGTTVVPLYH